MRITACQRQHACDTMNGSKSGRRGQTERMRSLRQTIGSKGLPGALICVLVMSAAIVGCQTTVKIEQEKPIIIQLDIKAEVLIRVEEIAKEDIAANPEVF